MRTFLYSVTVVLLAHSALAQTLTVKIVERHYSETDYTYVVGGFSTSNSLGNVDCSSGFRNVNCNGSDSTTTYTMPAQQVPFQVRGATFSLRLPDGRIAVVNCESKFAERFAGPRGNRRSCRMPLVDELQVEFKGDRAKLMWSTSIDGRKTESETYNILGILKK